jgi:spheroidene monooxygenase
VPAIADGSGVVAGHRAPHSAHAVSPEPGALSSQVALLALVDLEPRSRGWGWLRFVTGRMAVRGTPGLRFVKVLGSGRGGGFGTAPSPTIQGLFCVFDDAASADAFVSSTGAFQAWRSRARECFTVKLRAYSVRGSWSGMRPALGATAPVDGPIAALTRASIRPTRARRFWRMEPQAERELEATHGCLLATGVGEAPLLRQATFTLWDSVASMDAYARTGAHLAAIRASAQGAFFSESMFVRFVPEGAQGSWRGRSLA